MSTQTLGSTDYNENGFLQNLACEQNIHQNPIGKGWEEIGSHAFGTCHMQRVYKKSEMTLSANRWHLAH